MRKACAALTLARGAKEELRAAEARAVRAEEEGTAERASHAAALGRAGVVTAKQEAALGRVGEERKEGDVRHEEEMRVGNGRWEAELGRRGGELAEVRAEGEEARLQVASISGGGVIH
ncbi:hypothetical protein T484DRAFT_1762706 [Baffinella frigidus]|nr:hypothetical protein T484DRAFT_1762706 [Cryptophyta sp. CCMP2293]